MTTWRLEAEPTRHRGISVGQSVMLTSQNIAENLDRIFVPRSMQGIDFAMLQQDYLPHHQLNQCL
jgi:hypothetical protein